jgi:hypothetical protein
MRVNLTCAAALRQLLISTMQSNHEAPSMAAQVLHLRPGDETALQYLGAAVVLQWTSLPETLRHSILQQAHSVGGLPPVGALRETLLQLIERVRD